MKLSFSTLACPAWSWQRAVEQASALGYDGIEWRLIDGELVNPGFAAQRCREIRAATQRAALSSCALDSSIQLAAAPGEQRRNTIEAAREMLGLARAVGAEFLRVFNGRFPEGVQEKQAVEWIVSTLSPLLPAAQDLGIVLALEVHSFEGRGKNLSGTSDSELCREVAERLASPFLGILWDVGNPLQEGESLEQTWENVKDRLLYLHLKDMRASPEGSWQYVASGEGDVPFGRIIELLRGAGFEGWLSFEWEKKWHPELAEPEQALPQFIRHLRGLLP